MKKKANHAYLPSTILLIIQIVLCLSFDKILLDKLAVGDASVFREQYGTLGTVFMFFSLLVIFGCSSIFFEKSIVKYVGMLILTLLYTLVSINMDNMLYYIPMLVAILSFVCYMAARGYLDEGKNNQRSDNREAS